MEDLTTTTVGAAPPSRWVSLYQLGLLCLAMAVGAFGAGLWPMFATMSRRDLGVFNCLGTGLMLGTALAVILPEGIHQLFENEQSEAGTEHEHEHVDEGWLTHEMVFGLALTSGFLFMMAIDNFSSHDGGHGHSHFVPEQGLGDLGLESAIDRQEYGSVSEDNCDEANRLNPTPTAPPCHRESNVGRRRASVTLGLLVHAAADGVALGAAKAASHEGWGHIEVVVFFAIMMHKVPAAFALTVYLRASGLDVSSVHKNLLAFSLAAPLGAFSVFLLLHKGFLGLGTISDTTVAFGLLFSGGTFLYVALIHAFQDLPRAKDGALEAKNFFVFALGCFIPLFLAAGHKH